MRGGTCQSISTLQVEESGGYGGGVLLISGCFGCDRLQEVNAAPVRFISDLLVEDSWSHVFMDTLAPRGFVKVRLEWWFK